MNALNSSNHVSRHFNLSARVLHWAMALVGWSMLSAGGYPVTMFSGYALPPIAPHDPIVYAVLRSAHTWLALLLFVTVLLHLAAALYHAWVRRDGVFASMAIGPGIAETPPGMATEPADELPPAPM